METHPRSGGIIQRYIIQYGRGIDKIQSGIGKEYVGVIQVTGPAIGIKSDALERPGSSRVVGAEHHGIHRSSVCDQFPPDDEGDIVIEPTGAALVYGQRRIEGYGDVAVKVIIVVAAGDIAGGVRRQVLHIPLNVCRKGIVVAMGNNRHSPIERDPNESG